MLSTQPELVARHFHCSSFCPKKDLQNPSSLQKRNSKKKKAPIAAANTRDNWKTLSSRYLMFLALNLEPQWMVKTLTKRKYSLAIMKGQLNH